MLWLCWGYDRDGWYLVFTVYFTLSFGSSWLPTGRGFNFKPSGQRRRPLLFWWPAESWLRFGLPSAPPCLHTLSCQHLSFTRPVIHCFQWQLSPFGGLRCGARKRRRHTGRRGVECWRGVRGTRRERASGACWPRDASNQTRVWSQPAGGRPGGRERQWGEHACMSILMSLFSPSSRLQDSVLTPEIATYCSFYFQISYHFYDDDLGENSSLLLDSAF